MFKNCTKAKPYSLKISQFIKTHKIAFGFSTFLERLEKIPIERIRNFSIIAHIDHGKSTLADRIIEICADGVLQDKQVLDRLEVEKERGITIKAQTSSLLYKFEGNDYLINLVDTPGHADFAYEVERALKACEGALLVVDSSQGIQAQTMAHFNSAKKLKQKEKDIFGDFSQFEIIPIMNKIDLPGADPELTEIQVSYNFNIETPAVFCSAKTGVGMTDLLDSVVKTIPHPISMDWGLSPEMVETKGFRAFIFDSWFEQNRGVYLLIRVFNGKVQVDDQIKISKMGDRVVTVREVGVMNPDKCEVDKLSVGQVGYILTTLKDAKESVINLGGTLLDSDHSFSFLQDDNLTMVIPELIKAKQQIYASIYPETTDELNLLKTAIDKLSLEDPALSVEIESSPALGNGFRCGFLGTLHLDCFRQRLKAEYNIGCITTFPTVLYQAILPDGTKKEIYNPNEAPDNCTWEEPWAKAQILCKDEYTEILRKISISKRGNILKVTETGDGQSLIEAEFPLSEIIADFVDVIKTNSKGYASLDYEFYEFRPAKVDIVRIFITQEPVDALSFLVHHEKSYTFGKDLCRKLKELIPRQLFQVAIQARVGKKTIAAEHIKAVGKNVLSRCYGGDYTRKQKLIENQKKGKKKMRELGKVNVPVSTLNQIFK